MDHPKKDWGLPKITEHSNGRARIKSQLGFLTSRAGTFPCNTFVFLEPVFHSLKYLLLGDNFDTSVCQDSVINKTVMGGERIPDPVLD